MTDTPVKNPRSWLCSLFKEAVKAADPVHCLPPFLPDMPSSGCTVVIGAGKGSAAMARALEQNWDGALSGLVVTRYGFSVPCRHIEIVEAAHPVPDQAGLDAAQRILALARSLRQDDLCLALISGGASALLTLPADGIALADKQQVNRKLLASGATITDINTVRKHLSAVKGGRLADAVMPARLVNLLVSDIPGDDPAMIGSGPTVADKTTPLDAIKILEKFNIDPGPVVRRYLGHQAARDAGEFGDVPGRVTTHLIATPKASIMAAAERAKACGVTPVVLGDDLEGEARDLGREHAALARRLRSSGEYKPPFVVLSGGECTVTVKNENGRGGPNGEYALASAIEWDGADGAWVLACDTDGIDGSEDNAGAFATPDTLARAKNKNIDATEMLENNDSYGFFKTLDDLLITGPTLTNVNDFRAQLVLS